MKPWQGGTLSLLGPRGPRVRLPRERRAGDDANPVGGHPPRVADEWCHRAVQVA